MNKMRGRFAPSPTGELHLGSAWTALLAWLQVRSAGGTMVLRIEDIDPDRSHPHYTEGLMADLKWLGLNWDEGPDVSGDFGPYCQDNRKELYEEALNQLSSQGLIYPCYCTRGEIAALAPHGLGGERPYPGICRGKGYAMLPHRLPALRLAVPPGVVEFFDDIKGKIIQDVANTVGDFIVRRSDGVHAYQLAVVVDDATMRISHVLRGADLLDSTPRQIILYRLLGFEPPTFAHVPLLVAEDGHRLSKRQRDLSLASLRQKGARPERIIGYLAWKAGLIDICSAVSPTELIKCFNLASIPTGPIVIGDDAIRFSGADM